MKKLLLPLLSGLILAMTGCASRPVDECCAKPEIVYVDKDVSECTRSVQRITQVNPCATCSRFQVTARLAGECSR